ncbi:MAG: hypothetical protein EXQ88_01100 [Alphaproteobacteria bacterium]|nr:hypothetical protein [Alphaproteobacteria bacterium]
MRQYPQQSVTLAAAVLLLAGCSSAPQQAAAPGACPQVLVIGDTSQVTKFQTGTGRDPTDVVLQARISDFKGSCALDARRSRVNFDLSLQIEATRGPANRERRGAYEYFVAIATKDDVPLVVKVFPADVAFAANAERISMVEELTQTIPLRAGEQAADYHVYVGFQLTDAELAFNRARLRR